MAFNKVDFDVLDAGHAACATTPQVPAALVSILAHTGLDAEAIQAGFQAIPTNEADDSPEHFLLKMKVFVDCALAGGNLDDQDRGDLVTTMHLVGCGNLFELFEAQGGQLAMIDNTGEIRSHAWFVDHPDRGAPEGRALLTKHISLINTINEQRKEWLADKRALASKQPDKPSKTHDHAAKLREQNVDGYAADVCPRQAHAHLILVQQEKTGHPVPYVDIKKLQLPEWGALMKLGAGAAAAADANLAGLLPACEGIGSLFIYLLSATVCGRFGPNGLPTAMAYFGQVLAVGAQRNYRVAMQYEELVREKASNLVTAAAAVAYLTVRDNDVYTAVRPSPTAPQGQKPGGGGDSSGNRNNSGSGGGGNGGGQQQQGDKKNGKKSKKSKKRAQDGDDADAQGAKKKKAPH